MAQSPPLKLFLEGSAPDADLEYDIFTELYRGPDGFSDEEDSYEIYRGWVAPQSGFSGVFWSNDVLILSLGSDSEIDTCEKQSIASCGRNLFLEAIIWRRWK